MEYYLKLIGATRGQTVLKDKFPVYTPDILKCETFLNTRDEVIDYLKSKVVEHPTGTFIAIFDYYSHVKALEKGEIDESIVDSKISCSV